jgi:hypothetical protein
MINIDNKKKFLELTNNTDKNTIILDLTEKNLIKYQQYLNENENEDKILTSNDYKIKIIQQQRIDKK